MNANNTETITGIKASIYDDMVRISALSDQIAQIKASIGQREARMHAMVAADAQQDTAPPATADPEGDQLNGQSATQRQRA